MKFELKNSIKIPTFVIATCIVAFFFCANMQHASAQNRNTEKYDSAFLANHSAVKATLYSAVLPGLGQIYNKKVWKAPVVYALFATNIYLYSYTRYRYKTYAAGYADFKLKILNKDLVDLVNGLEEDYDFEGGDYERNLLQWEAWREDYQRRMHMTIIAFGAIYLLNVLDANVDAEFLEYDVSKDLTLKFLPSLIPNNVTHKNNLGLTCSLRF